MKRTFLALLALGALPLGGCNPSASDAQRHFEQVITEMYRGAPYKVVSFAKTDGTNPAPGHYKLYFTAQVQFPSGANPQCTPLPRGTLDTRPCLDTPYAAPGSTRTFQSSMDFQKRESGWVRIRSFGNTF